MKRQTHPGQRIRWHLILLILIPAFLGCNLPIAFRWSDLAGSGGTPTPSSLPSTPVPLPTQSPAITVNPTVPPGPAIEYQPVFEPAPCRFPVPDGYDPECGYLVVPENRSNPASRTIRLHLAIFRSWASDPAPDPVVHLAGGPGSSSLEVAGYLLGVGLNGVLERRDFILIDQRGTGYSQPRLDCPERQALTSRLLDGSLTTAEEEQITVDSFRQCRDRLLSEGAYLTAYNSAVSAADLNDLRLALGYPQLNLYGVSYGSRLALTLMRDYPEAVRSAVLDSTYPPQFNLYTALAPNTARAFEVFFNRCAADPTCSHQYPDLRGVFYNRVDELNSNPVAVTLSGSAGSYTIQFDGGLLLDVLLVGLYNPSIANTMPQMIFDIRQGDYQILRERLWLYFDSSSALGMTMAVQCAEEIPFQTIKDAYAQAEGIPTQITSPQITAPQFAAFFPESVRPLFHTCQEWITEPLDPRENQPVSSAIPTLILAGEVDPITPPDWGRAAAATLSNAQFYEIPGNGHWVTRSSACALGMALAFWESPGAAVGAGCQE